jgi:hypothetical protein
LIRGWVRTSIRQQQMQDVDARIHENKALARGWVRAPVTKQETHDARVS